MDVTALQQLEAELSLYGDLDVSARHSLLKRLSGVARLDMMDDATCDSICPYTKEPLRVSCGLKSCLYWNPNEWIKNCSLNYLLRQKADALSVSQVSFLYGKAPERVESIYKKCFRIVQRHYLKTILQERKIPRFNFIQGFCVCCQSRLTDEEIADQTLTLLDGHGYCSPECRKQYTPQYYEIEKFFETEFFRLIEVGSELFTFHLLEEILGFQPNVLRNRLEKIRDKKIS